jgi:hypothetical protein
MRRRVSLLLALPIALAGSLVAHQLAYLLSDPVAAERAQVLAATGHGYLRYLPMLLAAAGMTLVVGLALEAAARRTRRLALPAWPVALVAPVAFAVQEHLERVLHAGAFPTGLITSRTFLLGLAFQVPFALLAWGIAATLGAIARTVGAALRAAPRSPDRSPFAAAWPAARPGRPRVALDPVRSLRAPPALAPHTA